MYTILMFVIAIIVRSFMYLHASDLAYVQL